MRTNPIPKNSVLNVNVSCFRNYYDADTTKPVNLLKWLNSDQYSDKVSQIRSLIKTNEAEAKKIKGTLPAITPSGLFNRRSNDALIQHSGLMCIDIDLKGNEHVGNYKQIKRELTEVPYIAYVGESVSGTGYFALVPIPSVNSDDEHKEYYEAIRQDFERAGLKIDDTNDVARLRGYSFDSNGYFNHNAEKYIRKATAPPKVKTQPPQRTRQSAPTISAEFKPHQNPDNKLSPIDHFTTEVDPISMLEQFGYKVVRKNEREGKTYILRPDADSEYSGNYSHKHDTLLMYSTKDENFATGSGYNTFRIYTALYHNHDTKKAYEALEQAGYGGLKWIEARQIKQAERLQAESSTHKSEPVQIAPFGMNPYSGEVFDERGYPSDWDSVPTPEPTSTEYNEATLLIMRELGAEIDHTVTPEEIEAFWQEHDEINSIQNWRTR